MSNFNFKYLIISTLALSFLSCTYELDSRIAKINYGTSFGECVGFCRKQLSVNADSVHFTAFCDACTTPFLQRKDSIRKPTKVQWDSLRSIIPVNDFNKLAPVIGCPDCADGGAEWLELILTSGEKHKVTFEYNNEPTELRQYIPQLRRLMSTYKIN